MRYSIGELTKVIQSCDKTQEVINVQEFIEQEVNEEVGIYSDFEKRVLNDMIQQKLEILKK